MSATQASPQPLPQGFLKALDDELAAELAESERQWTEKIAALVLSRRDEAAEIYHQAMISHQAALRQADEEFERTLRSIDARGAAKVASIRAARVQETVRKELDRIRGLKSYPDVLSGLIAESSLVVDRINHFEAPEPEASILARLTGAPVRPAPFDCWGGFLCVDEGGTILDCTFRTRWERLQASGLPEKALPAV